jgi:hypothetical protein
VTGIFSINLVKDEVNSTKGDATYTCPISMKEITHQKVSLELVDAPSTPLAHNRNFCRWLPLGQQEL